MYTGALFLKVSYSLVRCLSKSHTGALSLDVAYWCTVSQSLVLVHSLWMSHTGALSLDVAYSKSYTGALSLDVAY